MQACGALAKKIWAKVGTSLKRLFCGCGTYGDRICSCFCGIFGECLEGGGHCISEFFDRPYAFCAGFTFVLLLSPIIYGLVGFFDSNGLTCAYPIRAHLIILVIGHILNVGFAIYCSYKFGRYARSLGTTTKGEGENVCVRLTTLISYEIPVCVFLFYSLFMFIWLILGSVWMNNLPAKDQCNSESSNAYNLRTADTVAAAFMWVYIFGGGLVAVMALVTYSCDEGSCIGWDVGRFLVLFFTCGLLDIGKKTKNGPILVQSAPQRYAKNKAEYSAFRRNWLPRTKEICLQIGLGTKDAPKIEPTVTAVSLVDIKHYKNVNDAMNASTISQNDTTLGINNRPNVPGADMRNIVLFAQNQRSRSPTFSPEVSPIPKNDTNSSPLTQSIPKIRNFHQINQV